ncbi:MAG: DUF2254 domain-containing protein [Nitrospirota bacterium]
MNFHNTKLSAFWDTLRTSYWFVPMLMAIGSVALWAVLYNLDTQMESSYVRRLGWIYTGGPEGAREVLAVIAGSMITVAGVVFSITIVALTLASQQFGPFLLRNFMRDAGNQIVLGTFIATFIFCLLTLRTVRGTDTVNFVPQLSVTAGVLLALLSLGVLIYFIHHVSAFIQASNIISVVSRDLEEAIDRLFPEKLGHGAEYLRAEEQWEIPERFEAESGPITVRECGYIKAIDNDALLGAAREHDVVIRLMKRPGDFVAGNDVIAMVWPAAEVNDSVARAINDSFVIGAQRTATQDAEFVVSQIVEVAVRALSPGINDPFTAVICIDHLGAGLRRLAGRAIPSPLRYDDDKTLRIIAHPMTFADMVAAAFDQIRHYGRANATVTRRLLETIASIAPHIRREEDRSALLRQSEMIERGSREGIAEEEDCREVRKLYRAAREALHAERITV